MLILKFFLELIPCLSLGYLIGRFKPGLAGKIAHPLINFGVPISLMGLLLKSGLNGRLFHAFLIALIAIGLMILLIIYTPKLRDLLGSRTLFLGSIFGNSGYFGIPASLSLLPDQALNFSIGYDLGATMIIWSLGPIFMRKDSFEGDFKGQLRCLFNALIKSPASKGLIGAVLIQCTPWSNQIASALWIPSRIVIVFALLIVGIRLGWMASSNESNVEDLGVLLSLSLWLKLIVLPALMLALSMLFDLPTIMRNALVLQAATPTAISVLLLAESSGSQPAVAADLVLRSTILAIISVPAWSGFLFLLAH